MMMKAADLHFREARHDDLPGILGLLRDDQLGSTRETTDAAVYKAAFDAISDDPNQMLMAVMHDDELVGTFQLSFIPGLARKGAWRGQIEAVRVARSQRGLGVGHQMIRWAIATCKSRGCALVQLTSDTSRTEAQRFYEDLGFVASHIGYKLKI